VRETTYDQEVAELKTSKYCWTSFTATSAVRFPAGTVSILVSFDPFLVSDARDLVLWSRGAEEE
jgi:hypothetical protein